MNKMEYQKPWAEFVEFSNEDIITASGTYEECGMQGYSANVNVCTEQGGKECTGWVHKKSERLCPGWNMSTAGNYCWLFNGNYSIGDDADPDQW